MLNIKNIRLGALRLNRRRAINLLIYTAFILLIIIGVLLYQKYESYKNRIRSFIGISLSRPSSASKSRVSISFRAVGV